MLCDPFPAALAGTSMQAQGFEPKQNLYRTFHALPGRQMQLAAKFTF